MRHLLFHLANISLVLMGAVFSQSNNSSVAATPRLLLENDKVRVFAVSIPASRQTFIRYQRNFLTVSLDDSQMVMWPEGSSDNLSFPINRGDTRFFLGGAPFGMRNIGRDEYRNVTVEFLDPRVTNYGFQYQSQKWEYGSNAVGPPADPSAGFMQLLPLRGAVVRDVQLLGGEQLAALSPPARELLIAVTNLNLTTGTNAGLRKSAGEIVWLDGRNFALVNHGTAPARFVEVELK